MKVPTICDLGIRATRESYIIREWVELRHAVEAGVHEAIFRVRIMFGKLKRANTAVRAEHMIRL